MYLSLTFILLILFIKLYCKLTCGKCSSKRKLHGMTALITGSNKGIGYYTALDLAKRGARVIITSENYEDLLRAQQQMIQESGNENIVAKYLDFLSLTGVRKFARDILDTEARLDIFVSNAGTNNLGSKLTEDGLLPVMQVNYLGPFLLTHLLLGLMKKTGQSRIVNVSSMGGNMGLGFDYTNINTVKNIPFIHIPQAFDYFNSKLCQVCTTIEMAKRLKGSGVTVNSLHTGVAPTSIIKHNLLVYIICSILKNITMRTAEEAAQTSIHVAVCERIEGATGKYYRDCRPSRLCVDLSAKVRESVWDQSIQLVKLKPEEMHM